MRWYNFCWHCTGCFGFPSNVRPCCADPCPDLFSFVLCYLVFQQFRMVVSRCDRQKAEVCECVSYMYFTISQDIGAIRLAPCCGPSKRCEIFMIWQPHHAIWWNFPFKTLFITFFSYKTARARGIEKKQTSDTTWIGTFPRPRLMNLSALSHITSNVLNTQRIWTLVYVKFLAASWQFAPETARMQPRHLAAQCEIPPCIAQCPSEIVSQRGVSHPFALFS